MTKAGFEALKGEYADQCCLIGLDNGRALFVGYGEYLMKNIKTGKIRRTYDMEDIKTDKDGTALEELVDENPTSPITMDDITVTTKGGEDFLEVHYYHQADQGVREYELISFIPLDQVQTFVVCPTKTEDGKRILPNRHSLNH